MENDLKNSEEFINRKTGKKTGFSAPTDYFTNLEETITTKIVAENFSNKIAFNVPNNYFKNLEDVVLEKVTSKEKVTKIISLKERVLKMIPYAAAASIVLFLGLNSYVFDAKEILTLDSLSDNDIEYWLESSTINTNDVVLILQEDILEDHAFSFYEIKDETIEDYINSIDNTSLLNEFN
ncbi:MAG: hypothetical protein WAO74_00315 [Polaribacter sp.]|uniref:hypothetical protein n=1 Tax=Polaribacter sp. TaxID=1920175 RepID=UPI003BB105EB